MKQPQSVLEVEQELHKRQREDPLGLVYKPNERQKQIHRSRYFTTLVLGGNRGGKSWAAVAESQYYALGRAAWAEVPDPPVQVWYVIPSLPMFRRSIKPIFQQIAPMKEVRRVYERDGIVAYKNGSEVHFLSADMRQRRLQGAAVHLGIVDETPDEEVFEELQARVLSTHGRLLMTFAPIDQKTAWVNDKILTPWVVGERHDIDVIKMPIATLDGRSLVSWFDEKDIKRMEQQWPDPAVRAARMYGEFVSRAGLVFKGFSRDTHVVNSFPVPPNYSQWLVIDPQYHRFACLFFAADERGNYYITDEYFSQDENLAARAERLAAMVGKRDTAIPAYVDSANPQDVAELNWHFNRLGASIAAVPLPMTKNVENFILRTHALLEPDDDRTYPKELGLKEEVYGAPRLMIFNTLCSTWKLNEKEIVSSRLLWEVQRLSWGTNGKPDKDSADGSDCCDCLIYGCSIIQSGFSVPAPEAWKKGKDQRDLLLWRLVDMVDGNPQLRVRED